MTTISLTIRATTSTFFCTLCIVFLLLVTGPARAELDFGYSAKYQNDHERALQELLPLAEKGDAKSQLWLGLLYYYGRGIDFNPRLADLWIRKAAAQLYRDAEFTVCLLYSCPTGGSPQN